MSRKFIAAVLAAALTIMALGNAPARADSETVRALAALAGIAIAGKVISEQLGEWDDTNVAIVNDDRYRYSLPAVRKTEPQFRRLEPRPLPRDVERRLLPGDCLRSFKTRDVRYRVFGKTCLEQNYAFTRSLPRSCAIKFKANKKKRNGYDAQCLRRAGYQLARR